MRDNDKFLSAMLDLAPARFGSVMEIFISRLIEEDIVVGTTRYDLGDDSNAIEVKFSRALDNSKVAKIDKDGDVVANIVHSSKLGRSFNMDDYGDKKFACNIQQIKPALFDTLYCGILFRDKVLVMKVKSEDIPSLPGWSDTQHYGNSGEGQCHITERNLDKHMENTFGVYTYDEVIKILKNE